MNRKQQEQHKRSPVNLEDVALVRMFKTPMGERSLKYLEAIFYNNSTYAQGDSHFTAYKVGQQDVVGFIRETIMLVESQPQPGIIIAGDENEGRESQ